MRERGYVNGDRPDSFNMNLTKDQKNQYGLQFDEEKTQTPGITSEFTRVMFLQEQLFNTV